jgi:uncharacterized protein (TIGR02001 family)
MKKIILATLASLGAFASLHVNAQSTGLLGVSGLTANVGAVSDYRFRGISQSFRNSALQAGVDYSHSSGLYVGNWNSTINEGAGFPSAHVEMDFYGGYKKSLGDFGIDVGAIYYHYPNSNSSDTTTANRLISNPITGNQVRGSIENTEVYVGGSWKWLSAKWYYATQNYFSSPGTKGTQYFDLSSNVEIADGWAWNAHIGTLKLKNGNSARWHGDYMDFKLGVTKDISGFVFGLSYITTTAKAGTCSLSGVSNDKQDVYCFTDNYGDPKNFKAAGASSAVLSLVKNF